MPREFSFDELAVDATLADEGVWFRFPDTASDFEIKIAHHDRPRYEREIARARRMFVREILVSRAKSETDEDGLEDELDPALDRRITARALARGVVMDWRSGPDEPNVNNHVARMPGSDPLPFTPENAERLLVEFTRLYQFVLGKTYEIANFRAAVEEDDEKN